MGEDKIWHYAFRLPDGRVLDRMGVHSDTLAFLECAKNEFGREDFKIINTSIDKETIEIFSEDEKKKAKEFADYLINQIK